MESLIKARRNLIIISSFMFLMVYAEITIKNELVLLGINFHINNLKNIDIFVFILAIYFFIRFFQNFDSNEFNFKQNFIKNTFKQLAKYIVPINCDYEKKYSIEYNKNRQYTPDKRNDRLNSIGPTFPTIIRKDENKKNAHQQLKEQIEKITTFYYLWNFTKHREDSDNICQSIDCKEIKIPLYHNKKLFDCLYKKLILKKYI